MSKLTVSRAPSCARAAPGRTPPNAPDNTTRTPVLSAARMQNLLASGRLYPPWSAQRCFDQLADLDQAEVLFRRRHTLERHGGAERRLQLRNRPFPRRSV